MPRTMLVWVSWLTLSGVALGQVNADAPTGIEIEQSSDTEFNNMDGALGTVLQKLELVELRFEFLQTSLLARTGSRGAAEFDLSTPDRISRADTSLGSFLISIDRVERHLDGFRVTFKIGNLSPVIYDGFTLTATWSKRDYSGIHYLSETFSEALGPGHWNQAALLLPDTDIDGLVNLVIRLDAGPVHYPLDANRLSPPDPGDPAPEGSGP